MRAALRYGKAQVVRVDDIADSNFLSLRSSPEEDNQILDLALSIQKHGLLEPLIVRVAEHPDPFGHKFELICGHRRLFACKRLSQRSVSCVVLNLSDQEAMEVALAENVQRRSLNPIEEAQAFELYISSFGRGSVTVLARRISKSEEYVSHRLMLLGLPKEIQERISRRLLKSAYATELVWLKNPISQTELLGEIEKNHLSFRQIRRAVRLMQDDGIRAPEAVSQVLDTCRKDAEVCAHRRLERKRFLVQRDSGESHLNSRKNRIGGQIDIINRAMLIVRTSLSGLDLLISHNASQDNADQDLQRLLFEERKIVHDMLDRLIAKKVSYRKLLNEQWQPWPIQNSYGVPQPRPVR
ncbi:MAG: ParB/RepB/Spo0J family partition protein [Nitrososphaerota archaeon]|nr:ParB/RepB/Spo0J family partition protein [Nitrososphaerota archaeon]